MFEPGDQIDDLVVEALLGQGSAAAIYRVHHVRDRSLAALKIAHSTDPTIRARMLSEGEVLQRIRHPNVVGVFRGMTVDKRPALLMELIEGPTLASWLDAYERPTIHEALELFKGIAHGVHACHDAGLIHRDLNPANVLLAVEAHKRVVPKLVDFGLARPLARTHTGPTLQGPLGTVSYMAPEQMDDARTIDHRADLYALGCILYEICTGGRAFQGSLFAVHEKSAAGDYRPPIEARPDMPEHVASVIARLLRPHRDDRYPSVSDMMRDLYVDDPPPARGKPTDSLVPFVFEKWSVSEVTTHATAVARELVPRGAEEDGVDDASERALRQLRTERAALMGMLVVALGALGITITLLLAR